MAVLYRGPHVVVTDDVIEVLGAGGSRYALEHLGFISVFRETDGPGRWHLMAEYRGEPETLFSSSDQREFAKVCRGLQRALRRRDDKAAV